MKMLPLVSLAAIACTVALPAAAQSRSGHEALPRHQDPTQTAEGMARTDSLNGDVLGRLQAVEQHNAEAARTNATIQANASLDAEASARANTAYQADLANYEAATRAAAAAQAQYDADMIVWRQRVRDCEAGIRAACSPQ